METTATVARVSEVGHETVAVTLSTPDGFDAEPGQFVRLGATLDGETVRRFYTLSSPTVGDTFEVTAAVGDDGFGAHLASLESGGSLEVAGPFGDQFYEGEARATVFAGGPGVGAGLAVAERAVAAGSGAALLYEHGGDPAHGERLEALEERGATVRRVPEASPSDVAAVVAGTDGERLFVYGFEEFVERMREAAAAAGGDVDDAKVESFG
jgi:ferredoxin-NADP reductase